MTPTQRTERKRLGELGTGVLSQEPLSKREILEVRGLPAAAPLETAIVGVASEVS